MNVSITNFYTESLGTAKESSSSRWFDSFVSLDALDGLIQDIASQKVERLSKQKPVAAKPQEILATKNETQKPEILATKKSPYADLRLCVIAHHNENFLEGIQPLVDHLRQQNINVVCIPQYNLVTFLATNSREGSFTTKASGQWDIILDFDHCVRLSAVLGIGLDTCLEAVLLHEAGHIICASIQPDYFTSELGAFAAGELMRQKIGSISQQSYQKLWEFCIH